MNWTMISVVTALAVLIPAAMLAVFAGSRDIHQYSRHYGEHGFSPQIVCDESKGRAADATTTPPIVESQSSLPLNRKLDPIPEWPSQL